MENLNALYWWLCMCCLCIAARSECGHDDFSKLSRANAFFADKLYKEAARNTDNIIVSPLSVSIALSMVTIGAAGNTLQELNSTLGFDFTHLSDPELLSCYRVLLQNASRPEIGYQFRLANAIFFGDTCAFNENYLKHITDDFLAVGRPVNFRHSVETLRDINGWVKNRTHGTIEKILEDVDPQTVMVLLNAAYFKGEWSFKFDSQRTFRAVFVNETGSQKMVNMMTGLIPAKYESRNSIGASVLELSYKRDMFSMIFLLPQDEREPLASLEQRLTPDILLHISDDLEDGRVLVGMPKFKLESELDLKRILQEIGVKELFSASSNLTRASAFPLQVSEAIQKATIEINEEGCEASAETSITVHGRSLGSSRPIRFWANRPFMFLLRHNPSNQIWFMGRVKDL